MRFSNVPLSKRKDFNRRLNCSIVNVLFFKRSGKEFHAAGMVQEKAHLPYVDSRHLGTSRSPRITECSWRNIHLFSCASFRDAFMMLYHLIS